MYNHQEIYQESESNNYKESYQGSMQEPGRDNHDHSRQNPNQISNFGLKTNQISGTYMRIVPKKPTHDYEKLYSQNIQLRQKIQSLEDNNMKLKTRISVADKQKQQILQQFRNLQNFSVLKDRRPSHTSLMKKKANKIGIDQNRRILYEYKDEINKLQTENGRLKKTVKYTQIKELEVEIQYLQEQIRRMKAYIKDVIDNTEYDDYEREIEKLNKQMQAEKDQIRSLHFQMKKKDEEIEDFKEKIKGLANRKLELEKRYNRDINNMKSEVHRMKQKQKQIVVASMNQRRQLSKSHHSKNRTIDCERCKDKQKIITAVKKEKTDFEEKLSEAQHVNAALNQKLQALENEKTAIKDSPSKAEEKKQQDKSKHDQNSQPNHKQMNGLNEHKANVNIQKQNEKIKEDDSDEEELYKESNYEESDDKVHMLNVDLDSKREQGGGQTHKKEAEDEYEEEYGEQYQEQFGEVEDDTKKLENDEEEEEVLFQKEEKKPKKKSASKKNKEKGLSKADKILKETIQYRFIAQRYTYENLVQDIRGNGAVQFSLQDLINMMSNEPFFLSEEHLEMVLFKLFQKDELDQDDQIQSEVFLAKMKGLIGGIKLNAEEEEQKILTKVHQKLSKVQPTINTKFIEEGNQQYISKKGFIKVLKQFVKLSDQQIQQSLAEASVVSVDIAHINHKQYQQKMLNVM